MSPRLDPADSTPSDQDLQGRREEIRRSLARSNRATSLTLLLVIFLAIGAVTQAYRASRRASEASEAKRQAEEEVWKSRLSYGRAARVSGMAGRKQSALLALTAAACDRTSPALRDEVIATLALRDASGGGFWKESRFGGSQGVGFSPGLDRYAVADGRRHVQVFEVGTEKVLARLDAPGTWLSSIRFSPTGRFLAAAFENGEVTVWDANDYRVLVRLPRDPNRSRESSFDFSGDERVFAAVCGTTAARLFELPGGTEMPRLEAGSRIARVGFRPDGRMLALGGGAQIELWNWPDRTLFKKLPHPGEIVALAWHPDNQHLASSCWGDQDIRFWDVASANQKLLRGHVELVPNLTFNHRGDLLVSMSWDGSTRFWDGNHGELLFISREGFGLMFSSDDAQLVYTRENQGFGIWKMDSSPVYRELELPIGAASYVNGFDFSPDGRLLAAVNPDGLHFFDLGQNRKAGFVAAKNLRSVSFTADGASLVGVGRDQIGVWRSMEGDRFQWEWERDLEMPRRLALDGGSLTRGVPPRLAVPGMDHVFWADLRDPRAVNVLGGDGAMGPITCAAISPDTNWVATSSWKGRGTFIWETKSGRKIRDFGPAGGFVAFSPDNRWFLIGSAHRYALWQTVPWKLTWEMERRSANELVGRGAFTADSRFVAIFPEVNRLELVETSSGRRLAGFNAPTPKNIGWVAFSPDGETLAASTFDNQIQLWNLARARTELAALHLDWMDRDVGSAALASATLRIAPATPPAAAIFYLLAGCAAVAAIAIAFYGLRHHRKMMASYLEIEEFVAVRNRELEVAQAELFHSQKMNALGTLATGIAHDFNNLLSIIRMGNNFLGRRELSHEDKAESSAAIERAVAQGKKIVRSMLGYGRERPDERRAFSVVELVEDVVLLLSKPFLSGLTLTLELDPNTPKVAVARGRLEQILLNLLVNASEAMNGHGQLRMTARPVDAARGEFVVPPADAPRYVELQVADSGAGIAPEIQGRIFEPFFSTKSETAGSGAGIGLSVVRSLARAEGMGIQLQSASGRGAIFRILIPAEEPEDLEQAGALSSAEPRRAGAAGVAGGVQQMHIGDSAQGS